jgi:hypothetical protein
MQERAVAYLDTRDTKSFESRGTGHQHGAVLKQFFLN